MEGWQKWTARDSRKDRHRRNNRFSLIYRFQNTVTKETLTARANIHLTRLNFRNVLQFNGTQNVYLIHFQLQRKQSYVAPKFSYSWQVKIHVQLVYKLHYTSIPLAVVTSDTHTTWRWPQFVWYKTLINPKMFHSKVVDYQLFLMSSLPRLDLEVWIKRQRLGVLFPAVNSRKRDSISQAGQPTNTSYLFLSNCQRAGWRF